MQDVKEMREVYCDSLIEMAATDPRIVVVEADLMNCIKTGPFKKAYPDRFFDVGVAEANMIGISAGLATCGKIPFCSSFGTFATRRCYDQIFISVAYSKQNVKIVGTDPGIAAEINGGTHMPFEDMGIMRGIPGMVCVEPTDCAMLKSLMPQIVEHKGPVYIRLFRKKTEKVFEDGAAFDLFKAFTLRKGTDVTIIASGIMVTRALEAADLLKERGISAEVINVYTWKPIDEETIAKSRLKTLPRPRRERRRQRSIRRSGQDALPLRPLRTQRRQHRRRGDQGNETQNLTTQTSKSHRTRQDTASDFYATLAPF